MGAATSVRTDSITPLYACPELARFALASGGELAPSAVMDTWAAGVVLLDVLAHATAFQEMKSSFDSMAMFEEEAGPCEGWYKWVADDSPLRIEDFVASPASSVAMVKESPELCDLLTRLLSKDPA